jgi:hypothetical protein
MWVFGNTEHEKWRLAVALSAAALLFALPVQSAWASTYTPLSGPPTGEDSHLQIISDIYASYGGTFVQNGVDFENAVAGISVKRVFDADDGDLTLHILVGDETGIDQVWTDGTAMVRASAKFADLTQSFGWNNNGGASGTGYVELLNESHIGGPPVDVMITGDFLWGIEPNGDTWWSNIGENSDATDHLMTYLVEGLSDLPMNEKVWLLFWEDLPNAGDADYNDFVIELQAIPEPGTLLLVGAGLLALGAFRNRRPRA